MREVILLDGGMGQELLMRSENAPTPLWSAQVMRDAPELVQGVHMDFLRAGAKVLTINTYSVTRCRLRQFGNEEDFIPLQMKATELVNAARDETGIEARIAGCLPPLKGSYLTDGTDDFDEILANYREIAELQAPHVDVFLAETMSTAREGRAAAMAAKETGKPVWLAWSLADDGTTLRSGETIAEAFTALEGIGVDMVIANCCPPESIDAAISELRACGAKFGAYANGFVNIVETFKPGKTVDELSKRDDLGPKRYSEFAMGWIEAGADLVGGCCEIGPAHIAYLANRLENAGYEICGGI